MGTKRYAIWPAAQVSTLALGLNRCDRLRVHVFLERLGETARIVVAPATRRLASGLFENATLVEF